MTRTTGRRPRNIVSVEDGPEKPKRKEHTDECKMRLDSSSEIVDAAWTGILGGCGTIAQVPGVRPPC
jgi:hypothetical protein